MVQAARRLYKPQNMKLALSEILALTRNLAIGYELFGTEVKVKEFIKRVLVYNTLLKTYGIKDHQVKNVGIGGKRALLLLLYRVSLLCLLGVFMIPGVIINLPVTIIARHISAIKMKGTFFSFLDLLFLEAKEGSSVKILGRDVVGTWKVMVYSSHTCKLIL